MIVRHNLQKEQPEQQVIVQQLLGEPPARWLDAMKPFEEGLLRPERNSMLAIYEVAALSAEEDRSLEWAEVAVRAADLDVREASNEAEREGSLLRAMRLRCLFISAVGARTGHPVLDVGVVLEWITSALTLPIAEVEAFAKAVKQDLASSELPSQPGVRPHAYDDLIRLRRIRHRLDLANSLAEGGVLPIDSPIRAWLSVRQVLP